MFYKLLYENGEYITNDTEELVNLVFGKDIYTPDGQVTIENPQGYIYFNTLKEALTYFNISEKPIELIENELNINNN